MKKFLKAEFAGWHIIEIVWMIFACSVICGLSVYLDDTVCGIISAVTGVLYTLLAGKGKLSAYGFGLINCVLYAWISFEAKLYGETILNALYYLPMMFVGFFSWKKNMDGQSVKKRHMTLRGRIRLVASIAVCTAGFGSILKYMGDALPFVDSFTTVASVIAMVVSVQRYSEQWWIWLGVNALSVYMWWTRFNAGVDSVATLVMWLVYLVNGIVILISWEKELKKGK